MGSYYNEDSSENTLLIDVDSPYKPSDCVNFVDTDISIESALYITSL